MLSPGTRLGPYEILAPLGAGGMGEVLRARDTRIGREVAIKLLPADVASDPDRLRRFEVEARSAGSLNHPNLVTIHEFGVEAGTPFLVMELLEGDTLRVKLGDGGSSSGASRVRLPIRKALDYSQQLASGLAAAHEKGIVHRDLKPDNIFITRDGRLKILDFGLAKLGRDEEPAADDATQARDTTPGTILGTPGYMSPEQVRGQKTDHRTDIFSCGAVLYEMLSGQKAFGGPTAADTMSAILHADPPELTGSSHQQIPPVVDRVVRRCLEKEISQRFESARDLAFALDAVTTSGTSSDLVAPAAPPRRLPRVRVALAAAALLLLVAAAAWTAWKLGRAGAPQATGHSVTQLTFDAGIETMPSISPDGKTFVFVRGVVPHRKLFLQRVDGRSAIALTTTDDDYYDPAFSPDGSQIAFGSSRDGGGLFVMGATGESVRRLTSSGQQPSWSPDGKEIVFSSEAIGSPASRNTVASISIVNLASGAIRKLATGDAVQPAFSPHGKRIVYWGLPPMGGQRDLMTIDVNGDPKSIVYATKDAPLDWNPVWAPDGKSLYFSSDRGGTMNLWQLPIDEASGRATGEPRPVPVPAIWAGWLSISRDGRFLVYAGSSTTDTMQHGSFDPATETITIDPTPVMDGSLLVRNSEASPDGEWIAFTNEGRQEDVWVVRSDGSDVRQLTNDLARDRGVSWSPDGKKLLFYSSRSGEYEAWSVRIDGSDLTQLTLHAGSNFPILSPDGKRFAFFDVAPRQMLLASVGAKPTSQFEPLPPIPGVEDDSFFATAWSLDGRSLIGTTWRKRSGIYLYSIASRSYRRVDPQRAVTVAANDGPNVQGVAAPVDDHRILATLDDSSMGVIDLSTNTIRPVGRVQRATISRNALRFLSTARRVESDIWLVTLRADAPAAQ